MSDKFNYQPLPTSERNTDSVIKSLSVEIPEPSERPPTPVRWGKIFLMLGLTIGVGITEGLGSALAVLVVFNLVGMLVTFGEL